MNYVEFGSAHNDTILLLHGGGLSWWNYREASAAIHVYAGEKETGTILRSAEAVCRMRPSCIPHRMKGLRHGEFSICHADRYADNKRRIISGESTF